MRKALWHVVLISFRPNATQATRKEVYSRYQTLDEDCGGKAAGVLFWKVDHNLDLRKSVHLVEIAIFKNDDALQKFRMHPAHKAFTENLLSKVADWTVGDIHYPAFLGKATETS